MNRDVTVVARQVYDSFMLLGDVGGLYGILISFASIILSYINYNKAENELVADLFMVKKELHEQPELLEPKK